MSELNINDEFTRSCLSVAESITGRSKMNAIMSHTTTTPTLSPTLSLSPSLNLVASPSRSDLKIDKEDFYTYPGSKTDFRGFPSNPLCIYKTGDLWPSPKGPEAQTILREARPVYDPSLQDAWYELSVKIYEFLESCQVLWTSIDPTRFSEQDRQPGSIYLWIGVVPRTLSSENAKTVADGCKGILADANFPHIEIAFRESVYTRSCTQVGPKLLSPSVRVRPMADIQNPFSPLLGLQIAPLKTPYLEGTGTLYLRKSSDSEDVMLLTNRHVALPLGVHENKCFDRRNTSQRAEEIIHLGSDAYTDALQKMMLKISDDADSVGEYENELAKLGEPADGESEQVTQERQQFQNDLMKAKRSIKNTELFYKDVTNHWTLPIQRTLGHVVYSPPVSLSKGEEEYTEDWALIKIKRNKIDWDSFPGNKIYIGESIPPSTFVSKMHPHPQGRSSFKFPLGGFLQVKGVNTKEELRKPEQLDDKGETCLLAIKNGMKTGDTIGRANGIESVVRHYGPGVSGISRELAIFPYSAKDGPFSAAGDSGALIVDGNGRIVGVLTGGSGATDTTDVTYATPFWWLEQQIKQVFPDSFLYPIVD